VTAPGARSNNDEVYAVPVDKPAGRATPAGGGVRPRTEPGHREQHTSAVATTVRC
jgi:hypothetical protein